jgi:HAE1 family hydrophobic/amphiphilic exporter-1
MNGVRTLKSFRSVSLAIAVALVLPYNGLSLAQDQQQTQTATQQAGQPSQQRVDFGRVKPLKAMRVGVNPEQIAFLSLHDAILKALENNNQIQIERTNVAASDSQLKAARGAYDITVGGDMTARTSTQPSTSSFTGGAGRSTSFTDRTFNYNFNASQLMPFGGNWRFQINNNRRATDQIVIGSLFNIPGADPTAGPRPAESSATFNPTFNSNFSFDVRQPLLRNFRVDQTRRAIRIQQKALDISDSAFRQQVINIITQVQNAYWDLVFAIRNVEITQESLDLAKTNLENNRKQVQAGTLPPIDLAQSEAEVQRRTQDVTAAVGQVTVMENTLKSLILGDPNSPEWGGNLVPTESIEFLPPAIDFESALKLAMTNRPELEQLRLRKEQNKIDRQYYRNQTLPQVDLIGNYSSTGIAGQPTNTFELRRTAVKDSEGNIVTECTKDANGEFPDQRCNDPCTSAGGAATPGCSWVPTPRTVNASFVGGGGRSLRSAFANDFRTYSFGLSVSFPIRNRTAEGQLGAAVAQERSLGYQERQQLQLISVEVRNALQQVETAKQNIEAARAERISRQRQLEGEQKKFEAGLSTTFFVLQFQNFLSLSRATELQALVSYNKAIATLQRVMSTTLDVHNIKVSAQPTK